MFHSKKKSVVFVLGEKNVDVLKSVRKEIILYLTLHITFLKVNIVEIIDCSKINLCLSFSREVK